MDLDYSIVNYNKVKRSKAIAYQKQINKRKRDALRGHYSCTAYIAYKRDDNGFVEMPYIRRKKRSSLQQCLKKKSNKKVRKMKEVLNYGKYKRKFDYWWTLD